MGQLIIPPVRWFTYYHKLHFVWKWNYERYANAHFNNQEWECLEEWSVFIGRDPDGKMFNRVDIYYDGHTVKGFTFLGICIGRCYGYEAIPYQEASQNSTPNNINTSEVHMSSEVKILQTIGARWGTAKKTAQIRAKPLGAILTDAAVADKFLLSTLEGDQPVSRGNLMCVADTGEAWQQTPAALLKKYTVTGMYACTGWMICTPLPENEVEFFQIPADCQGTHIVGLWGSTIDNFTNLQSFKAGDYVCRQVHDHLDQWVVRRALFEGTYNILTQPA